MTSLALRLARLPASARTQLLDQIDPALLALLAQDWRFWARPEQQPPLRAANGGAWRTWLMLAGRGFGKTRAGAEWVRGLAQAEAGVRIAVVGATAHDTRAILAEGPSGLMAGQGASPRPRFEPARRRIRWPNGSVALLYSAEEPDALRGPEHHYAWCDELAKWRYPDATWDMLQMGLRIGVSPQVMVTTTPRPIGLIKRLLADPTTAVTRGATHDNAVNLSVRFLEAVTTAYAGTRLGRQELNGELLEDLPGALWTRAMLDGARVRQAPALTRTVVAIDPPVSTGDKADACGLIVAARGVDDQIYVLDDRTVQGATPNQWAQAALAAMTDYSADRLIAEVNNGGALVESVLRSMDASVSYRAVRASVGKVARAEPVAALYERGLVHHVGSLSALEDELCALAPGLPYAGPGRSPDRADALVWAITELALRRTSGAPAIRGLSV